MLSKKERVAAVSVAASGTLACAKFVVGVAIGSLALISDALHSLIDLGATLVTWYAVRVSDKPPDASHHYGHGKVESLAALAETALLFLLAGGVAVEAVQRLLAGGTAPTFSIVPFAVLAIEMAVNAWRAHVLKKTARETGSQALEADSLHFTSDLYGSVAVIAGLTLSAFGLGWGDAAAALVVAVIIALLGMRMSRRTIEALMDAAPPGVRDRVSRVMSGVSGVVRVERLRVRTVGPRHFVDAAIAVPRTLPLDRVAALKGVLQDAIAAAVGDADADVTITTTPVALDDESVQERIMVIARNRGLAVHHLTVQAIGDKLAVALDIEVDADMPMGAAHEIASGLEDAVAAELGPDVEVETHIEPLQAPHLPGREAAPDRVAALARALSELARSQPALRNVHDVRVRETPEGEIVVFHCHIDPARSVIDVHESVDELERDLRRRYPEIRRAIGHAEPRGADASLAVGASAG
ncbi:cation diffusion facilitator family transporter [Rhodoplanes sp. TEM]|uniref:Cation diffusion facilitator family transporter n=1 Tax=Rhodoplanes tepidamans TaxID=200616 RepID=A0ABT5J7I6_RHOTP|nr:MULTISPECIES: cation diffusion facilitator family transporter [Rhodoplanes]MDC7785437.1 cation diffusion facilitator family transporter [Rhodoplanes tepidamans]MDC7985782.1 cation diffusion facilitator family transporter [Rhodoplanes sp. TEM]